MTSQPIRNRSIEQISAWLAATDVLVIGLGCAGACAAIGASRMDAEVLVLERAGGEALTSEGRTIPGLSAAGRSAAEWQG